MFAPMGEAVNAKCLAAQAQKTGRCTSTEQQMTDVMLSSLPRWPPRGLEGRDRLFIIAQRPRGTAWTPASPGAAHRSRARRASAETAGRGSALGELEPLALHPERLVQRPDHQGPDQVVDHREEHRQRERGGEPLPSRRSKATSERGRPSGQGPEELGGVL